MQLERNVGGTSVRSVHGQKVAQGTSQCPAQLYNVLCIKYKYKYKYKYKMWERALVLQSTVLQIQIQIRIRLQIKYNTNTNTTTNKYNCDCWCFVAIYAFLVQNFKPQNCVGVKGDKYQPFFV